jgi:hypothetical protein
MTERRTLVAVKAALRRALRGLDGIRIGAMREGLRGSGAVEHNDRVPPGLPPLCGRRQTRRDEAAMSDGMAPCWHHAPILRATAREKSRLFRDGRALKIVSGEKFPMPAAMKVESLAG